MIKPKSSHVETEEKPVKEEEKQAEEKHAIVLVDEKKAK